MEIVLLDDLVKRGTSRGEIFEEIHKLEKVFFSQYPYDIDEITRACEESCGNTLLLMAEGRVAGYLIPLLFENKNYLQILTLAVNKDWQRKGYGTKLIERCGEIANSLELEKIVVRVDVSYPILKILKNLKYSLMGLRDIREFIDEGLFSPEDDIQEGTSDVEIVQLFPNGYTVVTKDIGKDTPFSFIPMIKKLK